MPSTSPLSSTGAVDIRGSPREAAAPEKIRDFRLLPEPFTVENEMLTPTMKAKHRVIEARYADLIDEMYAVFA